MKIFKLKHMYNYNEVTLFGIKISYRYKMLNKFISLGTNCFPRVKLKQYGIKPSKAQGELSCPFDLCVTPIEAVKKILENDFSDYFDDLQFDEEKKCWKNTKYNILYIHDDLTKKDFIERYKQRIENFRQITSSKKNILFVQALFNVHDEALAEHITQINNSLKRYCKYGYKYRVINLIPNKLPSITTKLKITDKVYYFECLSPYDENWTNWWLKEIDNQPHAKPLVKNYIKTIYKG